MLWMNPHNPTDTADTIAAPLNMIMEVDFHLENKGNTSLVHARKYNVGDLVVIINTFCNHRRGG